MPLLTSVLDRALDRARVLAAPLAAPLLPDDYLGLVDPLLNGRTLRARVEQVRPETADAATLVLRPGRGWQGHTAGQWVRIGVEVDGVLHRRSYSLTTPPRADGTIAVTVKAVADGFVSHHLVHRTPVGTVLRLDQADGEFVLPAPVPSQLLFVTGGSGITPVMGMLRELVRRSGFPDVVLLHSALRADDVVFGDELRALARSVPSFRLLERHTDVDGLLSPADLDDLVPDWRDRAAFACGPAGLLDALEDHWSDAGLALRTERFRPRLLSTVGTGSATFLRTGTTTPVSGSLLDAGEDAGVLLPSGCRMGICYGCVVPLRAGQVRDLRTGEVHGEEGDLIQTCISTAAGRCEIDA